MISTEEMWIHWAFSEATSSRSKGWCPNPVFSRLQRQIEAEQLRYDDLSEPDRRTLRDWIRQTREPSFAEYVKGTSYFTAAALDRSRVEELFCPYVMHDGWLTLREYVATFGYPADPTDARGIAEAIGQELIGSAPVIIARYKGLGVLIDGLLRATCFLKFGNQHGTLPAYVPV